VAASDGRLPTIASDDGPRDPLPPPPTPVRGLRRAVYLAGPASPGSRRGRDRFDRDRNFQGHFSASRGRTRTDARPDRRRGRAAWSSSSGRTPRTWTRERGTVTRWTRWSRRQSSPFPSLHESPLRCRCPALFPRCSASTSRPPA